MKLEEVKNQALALMASAGFPIIGEISVEVDKELPFMGYTTEKNGKHIIIVSGKAMEGNMVLNLLIHELSHIYRGQTGHPSHNPKLLTSITAWVMHGKVIMPYQEDILCSILNHIQDLYADDISFAIFVKNLPQRDLNEFFLSWIYEPIKATTLEKKWENAERLLSAAFAQANLERHKVADTGDTVQKAVAAFLKKSDKQAVQQYPFFKEFMVNLPEKVTEKEFEKLVLRYLVEFLKLTKVSER